MSFAITVNGRENAFAAGPGESLLEAGRRAGYTFPQACRNGTCFRCEGALLCGEVEHLRSHARQTAVGAPVAVLPCIVAARSNCALAIEGVYGPGELPVVDVAAQVVSVEALAGRIARVRLRLPAGRRIERLAGQYLEILDGDDVFAFSIASPPESGRDLELHVRHGEDNPASLRVLALLRREAAVTVRLPKGECTLVAEPRLPLLFVAGSTGFAQVKSFVEHAIARRWQVPITLCWGARTREELYLEPLAAEWARTCANIRFVPALSAESSPANGAFAGPVHEAALATVQDFANVLVYACGSPPMVYAALDAFVARGLPPERLFSDVFAWAPREP